MKDMTISAAWLVATSATTSYRDSADLKFRGEWTDSTQRLGTARESSSPEIRQISEAVLRLHAMSVSVGLLRTSRKVKPIDYWVKWSRPAAPLDRERRLKFLFQRPPPLWN